uniref:Putative secreted protein n=1 Tax=Anopheles marajoara TaxID=58244 RepID=A0A2M4CBF2_9DIPT
MHLSLLRYRRWVVLNRCLHHPAWAVCCHHRYDRPVLCDVIRAVSFRVWAHECMLSLETEWHHPTAMRTGIEWVQGQSLLHPTEIRSL